MNIIHCTYIFFLSTTTDILQTPYGTIQNFLQYLYSMLRGTASQY